MMRDPLVLLEYEIKRQPALARLAEQIEHLSEQAIQDADVPLPWMRDALTRLKAKRQFNRLAQSADDWAIERYTADPIGVTRRWEASEAYVRVGRTELLMTPGQLIWLDRKGIWIDTIFTTHIDVKLKTHTVLHGQMTRSDYNLAVRARARGATLSTPVYDDTPVSNFRIYRP